MSRDHNAGRSHNIKIENNSFESVAEFKYLGTTLTNQNYIQEEVKSRMKWGNACYHSAQNLLSSSSLSKNIKIKIHRTIILSVVFTVAKLGRSDWGRKVDWGCLRDEVTGEWRKLHNDELNDLKSPNIIRVIISRRMKCAGHVAFVYRVLVGKPERKRPLGRPRGR